jgi:hypothetical protein
MRRNTSSLRFSALTCCSRAFSSLADNSVPQSFGLTFALDRATRYWSRLRPWCLQKSRTDRRDGGSSDKVNLLVRRRDQA